MKLIDRWRSRRELSRLHAETERVRRRWFRAYYAYRDTTVIFGNTPGAWADAGPIGRAAQESRDLSAELREIQSRIRRMEQVR